LITQLLVRLGENPKREGLVKTPERVERSLRFLLQGMHEDLDKLFNQARFSEQYDEMVLVKDIEFFSTCEHHLIPFFGKCHVAYIPDGKIIGLSKIPRLVDALSRRLQVQERLTVQIAEALKNYLNPKGVGVIMEAQHLCTMMRGVQKQNAKMVTSSMLGTFRADPKTRMEFLSLVNGKTV
jgi:GTP cyclohydrolase I